MNAHEVNRAIERRGGIETRQTGSHRRYRAEKDGVVAFTTVSQHRGDIPLGTLRAIQKDMEPVFGKGWLL